MIEYKSYAKINVFLDVIKKYKNGYHGINSIFMPINLFDIIKYEKNNLNINQFFYINGEPLEQNNLIVKASKLMEQNIIKPIKGYNFFLEKKIPIGGGLGGGSSNAAAVIKILNQNWGLNYNQKQLKNIAFKIGCDVPYFINSGFQIVKGFGEKLKKIKSAIHLKSVLLIFPEIPVSTPAAYSLIDQYQLNYALKENIKKMKNMIIACKNNNYQLFINSLYNKFEEVIFKEYQIIDSIKKQVLETKCDRVIMTGSGSTLVAFYNNETLAEHAFHSLIKRKINCLQTTVL